MSGKLMSIRRAGSCVDCSAELPVGTSAYWLATERVVRCVECSVFAADALTAPQLVVTPTLPSPAAANPTPERVEDVAGGSAMHEYERRSTRELARKERAVSEDAEWRATIKESRPVMGRIAAALTPKPVITAESQSTKAWKVGSEGEERVAEVMAPITGVAVLHDRLVPGTRANIDHIVVGPAGVFVVDAKKYTGALEVRDVGGLFRTDQRLYVNNRDRTKTVDGVLGQMEVVRTALGDAFPDVPVRGVLCFIGSSWGWRLRIKIIKGVTVVWPDGLPGVVAADGFHAGSVEAIADHLRSKLKPAK